MRVESDYLVLQLDEALPHDTSTVNTGLERKLKVGERVLAFVYGGASDEASMGVEIVDRI